MYEPDVQAIQQEQSALVHANSRKQGTNGNDQLGETAVRVTSQRDLNEADSVIKSNSETSSSAKRVKLGNKTSGTLPRIIQYTTSSAIL